MALAQPKGKNGDRLFLADDNRYRRDRTSINAVPVDLVIVNNNRLADVVISYRPLKLAPALDHMAPGIG